MKQVIYIYGASGSGTSTLGKAIAEQLGFFQMDSDDYFWMSTDPKFTTKREKAERIRLMRMDLDTHEKVVISGSIADWGNEFIPEFTLAIRLVTDTETRIDRLRQREYQHFGDRIYEGGDMYENHKDFIEWAEAYDTAGVEIRSKASHDEWEKQLRCPLIVLNGTDQIEENLCKVREAQKREQ